MSIDLSQFIATFLEESYEGIDVMENSLLSLEADDDEAINVIFRAAHSIKGGAGTFGFNEVADFTHVVETLLDEVRSGQQNVTPDLINLLLESVDCIKGLLEATQDGPQADLQQIEDVKQRLQVYIVAHDGADDASEENTEDSAGTEDQSWEIHFSAESEILENGHEPALMFSALADLGTLSVTAELDALPALSECDPQLLYLSWSLNCQSDCPKSEIAEVFEWVEDECRLVINKIVSQKAHSRNWQISFAPQSDVLNTGNDPALMFIALAELGDLKVVANTDKLLSLHEHIADALHISWQLSLNADCEKQQIADIFEWVEDLCELQISELSATDKQQNNAVDAKDTSAGTADNKKADGDKAKARSSKAAESTSIRVDTDKIDSLINRVGELVITQAMLGQVGDDLSDIAGVNTERLQEGLEQLERNTRDLQEDVMRVRMLPVSFVFNRFPRLVHDVSGKLSKKVELIISGEQTEIDKTVMEKIGDPMVHLVRNSLDHGLEEPAQRIAAGKPETGTLKLDAYHQGGFVVIDIIDDGNGLNTEKIRAKAIEKELITQDQQLSDDEINGLIFKPGFSTADVVSDLSGRGVGLDVVMRNIESLGGQVSVKSEPGKGSAFSIKLPLTLAILEGQLVRVHEDTYVIPLVSIVETIVINKEGKNPIAGEEKLLHFRDEYISHLDLKKLFNLPGADSAAGSDTTLVAIVENAGKKVGLVVDELYGQQQVVIKSLEVNFKRIEGLSGATILGDGSVALILDVAGLIQRGLNFEVASAVQSRNKLQNERTQGYL
ncbi:hypothetical protein A9R01_16520 ['Osedax' symbiont bacterium Rs2_46_30_T18]|nr:hypothetical protein A9R01_16520 ['Osedax' symbiont bacterium Rs2_46_30_T18]